MSRGSRTNWASLMITDLSKTIISTTAASLCAIYRKASSRVMWSLIWRQTRNSGFLIVQPWWQSTKSNALCWLCKISRKRRGCVSLGTRRKQQKIITSKLTCTRTATENDQPIKSLIYLFLTHCLWKRNWGMMNSLSFKIRCSSYWTWGRLQIKRCRQKFKLRAPKQNLRIKSRRRS